MAAAEGATPPICQWPRVYQAHPSHPLPSPSGRPRAPGARGRGTADVGPGPGSEAGGCRYVVGLDFLLPGPRRGRVAAGGGGERSGTAAAGPGRGRGDGPGGSAPAPLGGPQPRAVSVLSCPGLPGLPRLGRPPSLPEPAQVPPETPPGRLLGSSLLAGNFFFVGFFFFFFLIPLSSPLSPGEMQCGRLRHRSIRELRTEPRALHLLGQHLI
nr:cell division control protein 42 homolog isoform X1 [Peromyscus maniculatus bairdii]